MFWKKFHEYRPLHAIYSTPPKGRVQNTHMISFAKYDVIRLFTFMKKDQHTLNVHHITYLILLSQMLQIDLVLFLESTSSLCSGLYNGLAMVATGSHEHDKP